jgi:catechol 2,3-dioxygenase-like lactoylglutathione lyase family enzyme
MSGLGMVAIVVDDYDKAICHYCDDLGFRLIEDTKLDELKRWVVLSTGSNGLNILLAKASNEAQVAAIGNSTGGRVAFFLYTNDFDQTYGNYLDRGIDFTEQPRNEKFGKVVVFKDAYGNKWDLIERV